MQCQHFGDPFMAFHVAELSSDFEMRKTKNFYYKIEKS